MDKSQGKRPASASSSGGQLPQIKQSSMDTVYLGQTTTSDSTSDEESDKEHHEMIQDDSSITNEPESIELPNIPPPGHKNSDEVKISMTEQLVQELLEDQDPKLDRITIFGNEDIEKGLHTKDNTHLRSYPRKPVATRHVLPKYQQQQIIMSNLQAKSHGDDLTPAILLLLIGTEFFFYKKCTSLPNDLRWFKDKASGILEIRNKANSVLYYAGEIGCCRFNYPACPHRFAFQIIDVSGNLVLTVHGEQYCNGTISSANIKLGEEETYLGSVYQSCCSTNYEVRKIIKSEEKMAYSILAPCFAPLYPFVICCCNEHFEISQADGVTVEGDIRRFWDKEIPGTIRNTFGIQLPKDMGVEDKALLLGTAFLIYFQFYRGLGNGLWMVILFLTLGSCIYLLVRYSHYLES